MSFVVGYAIGSRRFELVGFEVQSCENSSRTLNSRLNFGTGTKGANSGAVVGVKLPNCESIASFYRSRVLARTGFESL